VRDIEAFCGRLDALRELRGREVVERWKALARSGEVRTVVRELLVQHYDPIYLQSMKRNYAAVQTPRTHVEWDGTTAKLVEAVARLVADS
jgi:tRNA 2-selenouridine synthase